MNWLALILGLALIAALVGAFLFERAARFNEETVRLLQDANRLHRRRRHVSWPDWEWPHRGYGNPASRDWGARRR